MRIGILDISRTVPKITARFETLAIRTAVPKSISAKIFQDPIDEKHRLDRLSRWSQKGVAV
jgi:hypothetical protein